MNEKYETGKQMVLNGVSITKVCAELGISRKWFSKFLVNEGVSTSVKKIQYNRDFFKVINSPEKAYWLGFIMADGCINQQVRDGKLKAMTMELGLARVDESHLMKFCESINLGLDNIRRKTTKLRGKEFEVSRVVLSSTELCRDLMAHGVTPKKTYSAEIPDEILNSEYLRDFVRGFFDGDGHIIDNKSHRNGFAITSASPKVLVQLKVLFMNIGCKDVEITQRGTRTYEMFWYDRDSTIKALTYMYKDSSIYLDRKYNKFIAHLLRD